MRAMWIGMVMVLLVLSACNTVQGIGTDIKKAGQGLEKAGQ